MANYTIYLKTTNRCQLKCDHCFNEIMNDHSDMTPEMIERSIDWINDFIKSHPDDTFDCQLFGGEPCLTDIRMLIDIVKAIDSKAHWSITTNLVYDLTDDHIELFKMMRPYPTQSITMIQTSWDKDIRFKSPRQQQLWEHNTKTLNDIGIIVQPTICVSSILLKENPADLYQYMISLGVTHMNFERLTYTGRAADAFVIVDERRIRLIPTNGEIDAWMLRAYKAYQKTDLTISLFQSIEQSIKGEKIGCRARKCMETVFTINPDGSIGGCPNTANYAPNNVSVIQWYPNKLAEKERVRETNCLVCDYYKYCNGDCFQLKHDATGCPGLKSVYQYLLR